MDAVWTISLISANIVTGILLGVSLWLDKDGIFNAVKLKLIRGCGLVYLMGKDKKMYISTAIFSGKNKETAQIEINGLPYTMNKKKIIYHKTFPVLIFDEGVSEPLSIDSGDLNYGKMTPELLATMIILARQSGRTPNGMDKQQQLMFYLTLGGAIASGIAVWFLFNQSDQLSALENIGNSILGLVQAKAGVI